MANVEYIDAHSPEEVRRILNPLVREWFFSRFKDFSKTQLYTVKNIYDRKNILICAPTGGTKTLSAFLGIINYLVELALKKELDNKMYAVYVSPLKALSNDIFVNLIQPLREIEEIAKKKGIDIQEIRVGLRTGDTEAKERARQARKTPHIYVTTPESLAIVLTSPKFSEKIMALEFLVVDEIHALTNKRGVYLSLTLERLCHASSIEPVRIGLSATIAPLEEIAKFLVGSKRDCLIADVKLLKKIEIGLDYPGENLLEAENQTNQKKLYHLLDGLIEKNRTTLIFTNTRAATERIIHYLDLHFPKKYAGLIGAHHSSMSKEKRFEIEEKLRKGELKVVVSSTSLELGIDIGSIDLVILLRSPKGVARALQRIGRAGHKLHTNPRGEFIVLDRDDLIECGILMKGMIEGKIESTEIPKNALDVLAQQIFGMAITKVWDIDEILGVIRKSYCYENLSKEDFFDVISYLAGEYALEHRHVYAKIWYDADKKQIGKKGKLARVIYLTNIGTIPEEGFVNVVIQHPPEKRGSIIGKIDESFLERMKKGDIFVLGGEKYQFLFARGMKIYVRAGITKNPTIPSWFSEMLPLNFEVALEIGRFRRLVKERLKNKKECIEFIKKHIYCQQHIAEEAYNYFVEQQGFAEIPDDKTILIEKYKEEKEYVVFHSMYGRRVNDALARAYAYAAASFRSRDVEMGISDNGFFIAGEDLDEDKMIKAITGKNLEEILKEAVEKTEVLARRFRHCAARSLMILRSYKGRLKSVGKQHVHSGFLLYAIKKISNEFPILREARREVMEDLMDLRNAKKVLEGIEKGEIKIKKIRTPFVSPFGLNLVLQGRSDLIKIEDRAAFLKRMHELHLKAIATKGKYKQN
ncbi:MAG: ATP-dependent helicase [Nanoarchaeota archaeon]|nr:ATP-dependent helicase [Nanoarchaeota archaeon]